MKRIIVEKDRYGIEHIVIEEAPYDPTWYSFTQKTIIFLGSVIRGFFSFVFSSFGILFIVYTIILLILYWLLFIVCK